MIAKHITFDVVKKNIPFASDPQGKVKIVQSPIVLNIKSDLKPTFTSPTVLSVARRSPSEGYP